MKRHFFLLCLAVVAFRLSAQNSFTSIYGADDADWAEAIVNSPNGGYILASQTLAKDPSGNILLIHIDSGGDTVWTQEYGTTLGDDVADVKSTADLGYIILGRTYQMTGDAFDFFVIKIDSVGDVIWQYRYSNPGIDDPREILELSDGSYVAIATGGLLLKLDSSGNLLWFRQYFESILPGQTLFFSDIIEASTNNLIISGTLSDSSSVSSLVLLKIDYSGNSIWNLVITCPTNSMEAYSLCEGINGDYFVSGLIFSQTSPWQTVVASISSAGTFYWAYYYSCNSCSAETYTITSNGAGELLVAGGINCQLPIDPLAFLIDESGQLLTARSYDEGVLEYFMNAAFAPDSGWALFGNITFGFDSSCLLFVKTDPQLGTNCNSTFAILDTSTVYCTTSVMTVGFSNIGAQFPLSLIGASGAFIVPWCAVNVQPIANSKPIRLFPNPANDMLTIEKPFGEATFKLYNSLGQCVRNMNLVGTRTEISVADLADGVYYCNVVDENGKVHSDKLVIQ